MRGKELNCFHLILRSGTGNIFIKEKIWHDTQEIVSEKDGSIVFEAEVAGTEEIKF